VRRILAVLVAFALVLIAPAAHAASTSRKDGNDTRGALDLRKVTMKTAGKQLKIAFTTHDAFADSVLVGPSTIGIDFRVAKNKVRGIAVRSSGGRLTAGICTFRLSGDLRPTRCSKVRVSRVNGTTVRVTVPRARIDKGARTYRWRAGALNTAQSGACSGLSPACIDKLPNSNKFLTWRL